MLADVLRPVPQPGLKAATVGSVQGAGGLLVTGQVAGHRAQETVGGCLGLRAAFAVRVGLTGLVDQAP